MTDFAFGNPRLPEAFAETCCGKPWGCTCCDKEKCPFWNHMWKRKDNPDHPNHIPSEETVTT